MRFTQNMLCGPDSKEKVDIVYGGAYSIKSYYMESDNPRQMRGASQLLLDSIRLPDDPKRDKISKLHIRTIQEEIEKLNGRMLLDMGSTFLAIVPAEQGPVAVATCEQVYLENTLTAKFTAISLKGYCRADLNDEEKFSETIHPELLRLYDERRFMQFQSTSLCWAGNSDVLLSGFKHPYISLRKFEDSERKRCSRCNMREPKYLGSLNVEGPFSLCPSCAHKEFRGGYILRNRFRDECKDYAQNAAGIAVKLATAEDFTDLLDSNPLWFGTTEDYADKNGDIALLYADVNNLGGATKELKPYSVCKYSEFGKCVEDTVKHSLYSAVSLAVKQLYDDEGKQYPEGYSETLRSENKYPACFEIVSAGGDDICVLVPGSVALFAAATMLDTFAKTWPADQYGFKLSLSAGVAVGQASVPVQFLLDTADQLLDIAKKRAHADGKDSRGALDILNLNSDAQWATSVKEKLRTNLIKKEIKTETETEIKTEMFSLTMRPYSTDEALALLNILRSNKLGQSVSTNMLRNLSEAGMSLTVEESDLYARYLWSKQENNSEMDNLERLYQKVHRMLNGESSAPSDKMPSYFSMFVEKKINSAKSSKTDVKKDVKSDADTKNADTTNVDAKKKEKKLLKLSPWRDLVELNGQMGKGRMP